MLSVKYCYCNLIKQSNSGICIDRTFLPIFATVNEHKM